MSVLIATRDRAELLGSMLTALAHQDTGDRFTYEVLVADNGSTDETRGTVETLQSTFPVPLRYLYEGRAGKPWALNAGLQEVRGVIIAFTDDDCLLSPTWLAALWTCFTEERADAVGGRILPRWETLRPAWLADEALARPFVFGALGCVDHGERRLVSTTQQPHYFVGGNLAVRREVIEQLGGFNPRMNRGQDTELWQRWLRHGKRLVYEPGAVVHHRVITERLTPEYFRMWWTRWGYYASLRTSWKLQHLIVVESWEWYRDVVRLTMVWLARWLTRRPWGARFICEVRLRGLLSRFAHRCRHLPAMWWAALRGGPGFLAQAPNVLDLERLGRGGFGS